MDGDGAVPDQRSCTADTAPASPTTAISASTQHGPAGLFDLPRFAAPPASDPEDGVARGGIDNHPRRKGAWHGGWRPQMQSGLQKAYLREIELQCSLIARAASRLDRESEASATRSRSGRSSRASSHRPALIVDAAVGRARTTRPASGRTHDKLNSSGFGAPVRLYPYLTSARLRLPSAGEWLDSHLSANLRASPRPEATRRHGVLVFDSTEPAFSNMRREVCPHFRSRKRSR